MADPRAVKVEHVRPGERNPVEGKFGQAKTAYGMNRIKARLKPTSETWIAGIIMVLNLVRLAGRAPLCVILRMVVGEITFSAKGNRALLMIPVCSGYQRNAQHSRMFEWKMAG